MMDEIAEIRAAADAHGYTDEGTIRILLAEIESLRARLQSCAEEIGGWERQNMDLAARVARERTHIAALRREIQAALEPNHGTVVSYEYGCRCPSCSRKVMAP